ncbi:iron-sulfur cluster biosynthesis family protein [Enterococcus sp. 669A]|uniref:Iron-sulfur cluster biosynthesis family protein n=1 Tax=Candidatus Enterococcus moelleringii TaxID=2815325 RepID=A0ABS3L829_9ENTE|nr:iron-sulfur cluster biosynthesis family protein [Enterococcus sp. 669A]MBO1304609.1 iron-sulfur cluster biosynthesis family protein [Enterococcus sp. 669A]
MKLTIRDQAVDALTNKLDSNSGFILALNDGSNQFSTVGGSCAVGDKFQIIPADEPTGQFQEKLENDQFNVYISDEEKVFLGNEVVIDFNERLSTFSLKNESGTLDPNILLKK